MSLRRALNSLAIILTVIALANTAALVLVASFLHTVTSNLHSAVTSAVLSQDLQADLQLHDRETHPDLRAELERRLLRNMEAAHSFVTSEPERVALEAADASLTAYLEATRAEARGERPAGSSEAVLERLLLELRDYARVNLQQAEADGRRAARLDFLSNALGVGVSVLFLSGLLAFLYYLRNHAYLPLLGVSAAMQRFGGGDPKARAEVPPNPREVREMAAHFNRMADALARLEEQRMAFLGSVAHDVRNPLAALKGSLRLVRPDRPLPSEERLRKVFAVVDRQIDRIDTLITDLLDLARIEAGRLELRREETDLRPLARATVELFEDASPIHRLVLELPEAPVRVSCDRARLEQVLNNLLSNAIKYSPQGGTITVRVQQRGREAVLAVRDEGLGIHPDDLQGLFAPYRRGRQASVSPVAGAGLGLFGANKIVEAHGGHLAVRSWVGEGSVFEVILAAQPLGEVREESAPAQAW